ncbi:MAG: RNA polymerase sigma factor [Planctomycetes bacterium]|nr:RNA polymerase sigma factor [Planctomycetota bacterium]
MTSWDSRATVELVLQARKQRPEAWKALFERCESEMVRFCRRFMGPKDPLRRLYHSQDIVQEAFATAMRKIESLENDASFYAWVRTIIRHKIAVKRRDELRERPITEGVDEPAIEDTHETERSTCEESLKVLEAILELFPQYPEPMATFAFVHLEEGVTPERLAEMLGVSKRTVYRRLEEATKLLRQRME